MTQYLFRCIVFGKRSDKHIWHVIKGAHEQKYAEDYGEWAKECKEDWVKGIIGYVVIDLSKKEVVSFSGFDPDDYEVTADLMGVDESDKGSSTRYKKLFKELSDLYAQSISQSVVVWEAQQKLNKINKQKETTMAKIKDSIEKSLLEIVFDD